MHLRALQVNFCDNHPRKTASAQIEDFQKPCKKKDVHDVDFLKCIGNVTINLFNQEHLSVIPNEMKIFFGNLGLTLHFVQLADTCLARAAARSDGGPASPPQPRLGLTRLARGKASLASPGPPNRPRARHHSPHQRLRVSRATARLHSGAPPRPWPAFTQAANRTRPGPSPSSTCLASAAARPAASFCIAAT